MAQYDPYEAASNPQMPAQGVYGQAHVFCEPVVLISGQGKVAFNPQAHKVEDRRTSVNITIDPMPGSNAKWPTKRNMLVESAEWAKTVWPSLRVLGLTSVRQLDGAWVKAELVSTGRSYTDKNGASKEATTLKFMAIYADEAACVAAHGGGGAAIPDIADDGAMPWANGQTQAQAQAAAAQGNPEKATALEFVKVLVKSTGGDRDKLATQIATMPLVSKYFTVTSPEVQALLA